MTRKPAHLAAEPYREVLNRPHPAGRYRLLDHNTNPRNSLIPILDEAPVNRLRKPHCQKGS